MTSSALDPVLSPTANVRRSCRMLMSDPLVDQYLDEPSDLSADAASSAGNTRSVGLYHSCVNRLASKIAEQILDESSASSESIEWDSDGWHYTAEHYTRSTSSLADEAQQLSSEYIEAQQMERKLLYILALDAINFCFWPADVLIDGESSQQRGAKNLLEYEHLASALRLMAEKDDEAEGGGFSSSSDSSAGYVQAEHTYAFSPESLARLTSASLSSMIYESLPEQSSSCDGRYLIPNIAERARLLNELGRGLLEHHNGSATCLLQKSIGPNGKPSAVKLVDIITSSFRGFRDEAVDAQGRQVCFYKRAQIAVGDIWAAFGRGKMQVKGAELTNFYDINELTTFADYRVPQLLRHVGVLRYSTELKTKVDAKEEIPASSMDELYIRAGTVIAVDRLVEVVRTTLQEASLSTSKLDEVNSVLIDWHLWQVGEKLDREGTLKPHHRVRTIFY